MTAFLNQYRSAIHDRWFLRARKTQAIFLAIWLLQRLIKTRPNQQLLIIRTTVLSIRISPSARKPLITWPPEYDKRRHFIGGLPLFLAPLPPFIMLTLGALCWRQKTTKTAAKIYFAYDKNTKSWSVFEKRIINVACRKINVSGGFYRT